MRARTRRSSSMLVEFNFKFTAAAAADSAVPITATYTHTHICTTDIYTIQPCETGKRPMALSEIQCQNFLDKSIYKTRIYTR